MVKGEDAKAKRRNKAIRKKNNRDPTAAVSARVAAIIAAKKRRHTGKRRQCQGMCFSLPTPEDPFNDRRGREDTAAKKPKKPLPQANNKGSVKEGDSKAKDVKMGEGAVERDSEDLSSGDTGCPSKFLFNCLNRIQDSLVGDGVIEEQEKSFISNSWGFEFWKSYSVGKDVLENCKTIPSVQQISWIASTAADSIVQKESDLEAPSPFLLYLVPSQERAVKVRSVFKPLKALGIHTVSLHDGSSVEHQVNGLDSCDPEFVVATPERLWKLVSLKAIDISAVGLLVVDAVDSLSNCLGVVKCIKDSISGNPRTVLFQGCSSRSSKHAVKLQSILTEPVTLSLDGTTDKRLLHH